MVVEAFLCLWYPILRFPTSQLTPPIHLWVVGWVGVPRTPEWMDLSGTVEAPPCRTKHLVSRQPYAPIRDDTGRPASVDSDVFPPSFTWEPTVLDSRTTSDSDSYLLVVGSEGFGEVGNSLNEPCRRPCCSFGRHGTQGLIVVGEKYVLRLLPRLFSHSELTS